MTLGDAIFSIFMICLMIVVGLIVLSIAALGIMWLVENCSITYIVATVIIGIVVIILL